MISERTTLIRLIALWLALAPLPAAFAYSETDLATLNKTGSCAGCDLTGADLYEADLYQADLSDANLTDADLTAADLSLADLRGADLRGAVLEETNLSGANLTNALLDQSALAGAVFDSERTRTTLGFKELKLGMNVVEIAQYCSITNIEGKASDLASLITARIERLQGHCFDDADMRLAFGFSGRGSTGVLNWLEVGIAAYTEENHRKFIDLLEQKYKPTRSYSVADVAAFNKDRSLEGQSLDTIFANGQVTLSVVSRGTGLQLLLSYRAEDNGQRFLDRKGGPAPVDLAQLPAVAMDLYKLVGNYSLKGIGAKGASANHGRIDTAYLEIDAFENELAGELAISGTGMSRRFRITRVEEVSSSRLIFELEPVEGSIPDGRPLRMSLEFAEDGNSFTGKWTNWFRLQNAKSRKPDDFKGVRSQSFWQTAMSHNRIDMYQAYLRLYPGGIYSAVARSRITELGGTLVTPSAPTVPTAVAASPSTPATATEPVDALAGIWKFSPPDGVGWGYLIVGINNEGELAGFQWQFVHSETFGFRETTITPLADGSYSWRSDKAVSLANPSFPINDAVKEGKFWFNESQSGLPTITSSKELFAQWPGLPPRQPLEKISYEEAVVLKLPPEVPPKKKTSLSPFVTEGSQVASVPEATASTSTTTTPVDPLVGIWHWQGGFWGYADSCYLAVGMNNEGELVGKSWETHQKLHLDQAFAAEDIIGSNVVGVRDITIGQADGNSYTWETSETLPLPMEPWTKGAMKGRLYLNMEGGNAESLNVTNRICRKLRSEPKNSRLKKLSLEEALALELPPELLEGFPSPFATEGQQVASVPEATASTPATPSAATVTTPVDPLVGIWTQTSRPYGNCYFIVGQRADGALAAVSFQNLLKQNIVGNDAPMEWDLTNSGVGILARAISIKPAPKGAYSWESSENFQTLGLPSFLANPPKKGRFFMSKDKDGNPRVTSNKKLCVEEPASPSTGTFRKLSLDDAIALKLPSIAHEGFPSPFATEGSQVASVPEATASTSTTTTPVDPLVGIWHWQGGVFGNIDHCYIAVGMHPNGDLEAKAWETHRIDDLKGPFISEFIEGSSIVGLRDLVIQKRLDKTYAWESTTEVPGVNEGAAGNIWVAPAMSGVLKIRTGAAGINVEANNRVCRKITADPVSGVFRRVPTEEALALELPPELLEGFPSPFATEGQQVASVPKETPRTSATTAPVDPLVGVWVRVRSARWPSPFCYAIVGQQSDGALIGVNWEMPAGGTLGVTFWTPGFEYKTSPPRVLALQRKDDGVYAWETDDPGHYKGDAAEFKLPTNAGVLHLEITENSMSFSSGSKPLCRRERWGASALLTYHKLSLEAAALLEFPVEVEQLLLSRTIPSPFELNTQWGSSSLIGQEITGAAQTTGAPEDASEPDRR